MKAARGKRPHPLKNVMGSTDSRECWRAYLRANGFKTFMRNEKSRPQPNGLYSGQRLEIQTRRVHLRGSPGARSSSQSSAACSLSINRIKSSPLFLATFSPKRSGYTASGDTMTAILGFLSPSLLTK